MHVANKKQRPNAKGAANILWTLAMMHHAAATNELLDSACSVCQPHDVAFRDKMLACCDGQCSLQLGTLCDDIMMT